MSAFRWLHAGLYGLAIALAATTLVWPSWNLQRREARARVEAETALGRLAARERDFLSAHHRYAVFGPGAAERQAALPGVELGQAVADFDFDAMLDRAGALHVRAVSRPDAIRAGRVVPLLIAVDLTDGPKMGQEEAGK